MLTGGGGGVKICQNLADVICERSLSEQSNNSNRENELKLLSGGASFLPMLPKMEKAGCL